MTTVCLCGLHGWGEPLLSWTRHWVESLHQAGIRIGGKPMEPVLPPGESGLSLCQSKAGSVCTLTTGDELKLVYPQSGCYARAVRQLGVSHFSSTLGWT